MTDLPGRIFHVRLARRSALIAVSLLALTSGLAFAQKPADTAAKPDMAAELSKPGPRGDLALGKADAPVTIIEYASLTCSHCAHFHNTVLPKLKEKYIDTGKVRLVMREFPLDNLAAAGSMLARCAGGDKSFEVISTLFKTQDTWAFVSGNPLPGLFKIASGLGFTKESFDKCLTDQKLLDDITSVRDKAGKTFGVRATPSFFINGKKMEERSDVIESFDKVLEPLLKKP